MKPSRCLPFLFLLVPAIVIFPSPPTAYSEYVVVQLTHTSYQDDVYPQINDTGHVVWERPNTELFLFDGSVTTKVRTNADYLVEYPQINDNSYLVWFGGDGANHGTREIFLYDGMG